MTATVVASPPRIAARSWWADMAHGSIYMVAAIGAAGLMSILVLLVSRAPFIESIKGALEEASVS